MRRVVITGLGAVTPVGNNVQETWASLTSGKCGIGPITRFDTTGYAATVAAELKDFDPLLYFEQTDLRKYDRFTQYAVAAAQQAAEDSGIQGAVEPERLGVYLSSGIGGLETTIAEANKMAKGSLRLSPFLIPKMICNMAAGVVGIMQNAKGPTLPVVTACASSGHTIGEAFRAIKHGYADAIFAGGSEATILPFAVAGFTACQALSQASDPSAACLPFDKRRSGFVMGEGSVVLVLEELERAQKRGAHIYAEVTGYGNTCDAYHMTAPDPEGAGSGRAITLALEEAGLIPDENTYVNAHGTGTGPNDRTETMAFKQAFGEAARKVAISSTKSMTGHMLGAAGAVEALASALALENGIAPPTIGYAEPDPDCDLNYTPNTAAKRPFTAAVSTSLGFGGHNACLVFSKAGV
ncbi:beta-ketoacyl-ACP synthase II [Ruminococcaceae bacterium OttesenSCG-928-D13]|nr:beta-ketoacyl-ACP synthase II [Ruminococcaceae bacterium OttesenSCG-928-D13]